MNWIKKEIINSIRRSATDVLQRTLDRNIKLAVTGLSRSGKTAFITSLVHQLLHTSQSSRLPLFAASTNGQWLGAKILEQEHFQVPTFPYEKAIKALSNASPSWPESTKGISEIRVAIRYRPSNIIEQRLIDVATLTIDIVDYPGEWLLDLPMLKWDYSQWTQAMADLNESSLRQKLSKKWLDKMAEVDPSLPMADSEIEVITELYTEYLHACKEPQHGLSLVQPGRFILPGEFEGAPMLKFFPLIGVLPSAKEVKKFPENALYHVLNKRFEQYKAHIIEPFYKNFFKHFDRQVVLVDCLQVLNDGYDSFLDMQMAVKWVLKNFQYGTSSFIHRLFSPKIDKLIFGATKADCVTPNQHHNLTEFLKKMVYEANNEVRFEGIETCALSFASINCTRQATAQFQNQSISCLKGHQLADNKEIAVFPGEVPSDIPAPPDWSDERFNFIEFRPPINTQIHNKAIDHIRMDRVLQELIGDKF